MSGVLLNSVLDPRKKIRGSVLSFVHLPSIDNSVL